MAVDRQGNHLSGATPEAARHFDQALAEFNLYRGDPVASLDRAVAAAPGFVMAPTDASTRSTTGTRRWRTWAPGARARWTT